MSARFKPLPVLEGEQALAADPQAHAALSASAGTGKTQVLTARVLRLLLQGAKPESILCLTFTKAAAAEMANRIGSRLASWVRLSDKVLRKELFALGERDDPRTLERARQLFARVLECAGGLKIQTIHSFAQSLLAAFPAEAGILPGFEPIQGRGEQELVRVTLADLLAHAEATGYDQLMRDVQCLSRRLGEGGAVDYLRACAGRAEALNAFGARDTIEPRIRSVMALPEGSAETYLAERCAQSPRPIENGAPRPAPRSSRRSSDGSKCQRQSAPLHCRTSRWSCSRVQVRCARCRQGSERPIRPMMSMPSG
jgi:ATP-dependent helicase/nuclease subunit A